jgi:uncharacterized protein (TIGR03000 family)
MSNSSRKSFAMAVVVALWPAALPTFAQYGGGRGFGGYAGRGGYFNGGVGGTGEASGLTYGNGRGYNGYGFYPPNGGYSGYGNSQGYGGYGGSNGMTGNNMGYNPYIIVPYPIGNGNGYGNGQPQGGYPYGPGGPAPNPPSPQSRFAPRASTYITGPDGSTAFYATPTYDPSAGDTPPAADNRAYYPSDSGISPSPASIPSLVTPPPMPPADGPPLGPPPARTPPPPNFARVLVHVPPEAHLWFEGTETRQDGSERTFRSPPLDPDRHYLYDLKARWWEDGKPVVKSRTIIVRAGQVTNVDMTGGGE